MKTHEIYRAVLSLTTILVTVCCSDNIEKYYDWPEWPTPSSPTVQDVTIGPLAGSSGEITAGQDIKIKATVTDLHNELETIGISASIGNRQIVNRTFETDGYEHLIDIDVKIPFIANMDSGEKINVNIAATNDIGGENVYAIPEDQQPVVMRPAIPSTIYMVNPAGENISMQLEPGEEYLYKSNQDISSFGNEFKIASALTEEGKPDYSLPVWGQTDGTIQTIYSENDGYIIAENTGDDEIGGYTFDTYSFSVASLYPAVTINAPSMVQSSYPGYKVAKEYLRFGNDVIFEGFGDIRTSINPTFFTYRSDNRTTFTGINGEYDILLQESTGHIYIENRNMRHPDAMWICGTGLGFPQMPYVASIAWLWNTPSDYIFLKKAGNQAYTAIVYANSSYGFKFFKKSNWGEEDEEWSSDYTLLPEGYMAVGDNGFGVITGDCIPDDKFPGPGIYELTIDIDAKTITMELIEKTE